jgi:MFS family permease
MERSAPDRRHSAPVSSARYKNYLLFVLLVVLAFNSVDRLALGLMLQDIKVDLDLTDTQLGLMTGFAFALFYSVMGIPIARLADRGRRITIISATTALWSVAVALCGWANSFIHLLLIRVAVAIGEAGCVPPAHSVIADTFGREERPRAVARYMLGTPLSALIGYFAAGWLNEYYGWRTTFVLLGLPGIALALVVALTLREPPRRPAEGAGADIDPTTAPPPGLLATLRILWSIRTYRYLLIAMSILSFFSSGIGKWQPTFFVRSYGLSTGELGTWFTLVFGIGGVVGTLLGGELASRYAANDERRQLLAIAIIYSALSAIWALIYVSPNHYLAFAWLGLAIIAGMAALGPLFAMVQTLVPPGLRAMSVAILFFFSNLIGGGLGPFAAGVLSDWLHTLLGNESLRYALLALCPGNLIGGYFVWRASRTATSDIGPPAAPTGAQTVPV